MEGLPVERLREYLRQLPPSARALLVTELERTVLRGEEIPGGDLVLREVRSAVREAGEPAQRIGDPARLFFAAVEPFLVDDGGQKQQYRISRVSLEPVWTWLCRDIAPAEAKTYSDAVSRALAMGQTAQCARLASEFQDLTVGRIGEAVASIAGNEKARRRLAGQLGAPRAIEDLHDLVKILQARDALAQVGDRLPAHIRNLSDAVLDGAKAALDAPAARQNGVLPYALVVVMSRLAAPWQLIRLAVKAAQSDEAIRIVATPYATAVTIVLAEIGRMVEELRNDLHPGGNVSVTSLLRSIHDAARGLRTELDLPVDQQWGRQLAAIRSEVSNLLKTAIEPAPARVRRLVRPRPASEIKSGNVLDATEVAEAEALIELVGACRTYASELAISEMTTRVYGELQQILDSGTKVLLDGLRSATPTDRAFRRSQVDAALRFCGKVFGQEYASLLAKAADVASQAERKVPVRA